MTAAALAMTNRQRAIMVACAYVPFLNIVVACAIAFGSHAWIAIAWLLLAPPLVVRATLAAHPLPRANVPLASGDFLVWWFTSQWQAIFNRLPWIEELIRLVPGAYSAWMRLWGARVGRFVYWTPGLRILDRSLVDVGQRVTFGAGVRINPHLIARLASREAVLLVARVRIGDDAMIGGYSTLLAGCWIATGEATPARRELRPVTGWRDGRRVGSPHGDRVEGVE